MNLRTHCLREFLWRRGSADHQDHRRHANVTVGEVECWPDLLLYFATHVAHDADYGAERVGFTWTKTLADRVLVRPVKSRKAVTHNKAGIILVAAIFICKFPALEQRYAHHLEIMRCDCGCIRGQGVPEVSGPSSAISIAQLFSDNGSCVTAAASLIPGTVCRRSRASE